MINGIFRFGRTLRVALLTIFVAALFPFRRLFGSMAGPRLLRWYFETCEAAFIKIGQLLAVRYDLLPVEYCRELGKLLDQVPSVPFSKIQRIIENDLGKPLTECFASIERVPIASASIAQVHYALLDNGQEVAVKIMRPSVRRQFRADLSNAQFIGRILDFTGVLGAARVSAIVSELARIVSQELDFRKEARHTQILHETMESDPIDHYAPFIYFKLCGDRVITQERLKGVWVNEIIDAINHQDTARLKTWEAQGIYPVRVGRILFRSVMEQCYRHRIFHADPHAANLVVLPDGALGFIDFGSVGWLDEQLWAKQRRMFDNISHRNIHGTYEALVSTLEPFEARDLSGLESDVKELFWEWITAAEDPRATPLEKSNGRLLLQVADAIRRSNLTLPWRLIRVYRAQIVTDMIVYTLFPKMNPITELSEFFDDEVIRQAEEIFSVDNFHRLGLAAFRTVGSLPEVTAALTDWATNKLPLLGRTLGEDLSRFERGMTYLIDVLRVVSWIAGIVVLVLKLAKFFPASNFFNEAWWMLAGAFFLFAFLFSRVLWHIRYPD